MSTPPSPDKAPVPDEWDDYVFGDGMVKQAVANNIAANTNRIHSDTKLRRNLGRRIGGLFVQLNAAIVIIIFIFAISDWVMMALKAIDPANRIVTEKILLTLIGATVIQAGIAFASIVGNLFPQSAGDGSSKSPSRSIEGGSLVVGGLAIASISFGVGYAMPDQNKVPKGSTSQECPMSEASKQGGEVIVNQTVLLPQNESAAKPPAAKSPSKPKPTPPQAKADCHLK